MEFLSKKQKIMLIIVGTLIAIFIGYYIIQKTSHYRTYEELEIIEETNSIRNTNSRWRRDNWRRNCSTYNRRGSKRRSYKYKKRFKNCRCNRKSKWNYKGSGFI